MVAPIRVYPPGTTVFTGNGLCCLCPKSAEVIIKDKEAHSVTLEHPIDDFGIWKNLKISNIMYIPIKRRGIMTYQPMRIYEISPKRSNSSVSITVKARHVLYDNNCVILQDVRPTALNGKAALDWLFANIHRPTTNPQASDNFTYNSDITDIGTAYYEYKTLTAALIGEKNSILNVWGGELYVDGFYFSINKRMENALDNAFNLRYGFNLTGITATYSNDKSYNALIGKSNTGTVRTGTVPASNIQLPFDKVQYAQFSYSNGEGSAEFNRDFDEYLAASSQLSAGYSVNFEDLGDTDEYAGFRNLESCEVGDTGLIYDSDLEISTVQRIVEKKIDVIKQKVKSIALGNAAASITDTPTNNIIVTDMAEQKAQSYTEQQIRDLMEPKKTAQGAAPLTVYAYTALPSEAYLIRGNVGGVGEDYGGAVRITIISNGSVSTVGDIPRKLEADDYLQRFEGGRGEVHYSNGEEFPVDIGYINLRRGANEVSVGGSVLPAEMEVIYR